MAAGERQAARAGRLILSPAHDHTRTESDVTSTSSILDDWVLCRIYNKKGVIERYDTVDDGGDDAVAEDVKPAPAAFKNARAGSGRGGAVAAAATPMKVEFPEYGGYYDYDDLETPSAGMLCFDRPSPAVPTAPVSAVPAPALSSPPADTDPDRDDSNNSTPWTMHHAHTDNSSCGSEHVLSPSPDLPDRDHAESQPGDAGWWPVGVDWGAAAAAAEDDGFMIDVDVDDGSSLLFGPQSPGLFARVDAAAAFGDMLASYSYLHRPF